MENLKKINHIIEKNCKKQTNKRDIVEEISKKMVDIVEAYVDYDWDTD